MPLKLRAAGLTDVGRKRKANEDSLYLSPLHGIYVVADGMGGHASGEVASKMAVETLGRFFEETARDRERTWPFKMDKARSYEENRLSIGVKLSNKLIYERAQKDMRQKGMGTTVVAISVMDDIAYIAHVGDSRVYRLRQGEFAAMTEDHSLLNDYMKIKPLTPEEIANFPHKNVIVRALGMKHTVEVDLRRETMQPGDLFLLCSDGLCGLVPDDQMANIVQAQRSDLDRTCQKLIDEANRRGGNDNITVMLLEALD